MAFPQNRLLRLLGTVATLALAWGCAAVSGATVSTEQVTTPNGARSFLLARPQGNPAGPRPLVLLLHGHGGSAAQLLGQRGTAAPLSVWLRIADREGLLLAALDGSKAGDGKSGWADCRRDAPGNPPTDDVAYAGNVVRQLVAAGAVDPQRVYAMGMSNGAMMVLRLAQEMHPPLAGFAAVSGLVAADSLCQPPRQPVPALIVAGTEDPLVPFAGGQVHFGNALRGGVLGAVDSVETWRRFNGVATPPRIAAVPPTGRTTRITRFQSGPEAGSPARVLGLEVRGGGHVEPSASERIGRLYQRVVGEQNHDIEVAEEAWRFFSGWPVAVSPPAR